MSWDAKAFSMSAKSWNSLPGKKDEAKNFINEVRKQTKLTKTMRVLDFGCGTGLNGLGFINDVKTVAFLDTSDGMIEQVESALKSLNCNNYELYNKEITQIRDIEPFDLILSTLSFHHIEDINSTVKRFTEDGSFHAPIKVPHNGFDPEELKQVFLNNGFTKVTHKAFGSSYGYPTFLIVAEK